MHLVEIEGIGKYSINNESFDVDDTNLQNAGLILSNWSYEELRLACYMGLPYGQIGLSSLFSPGPIRQQAPFPGAPPVFTLTHFFDRDGDVVLAGAPVPEDAFQAHIQHAAAAQGAFLPQGAHVNIDDRNADERRRDQNEILAELYSGTAALMDIDNLKKKVGFVESLCRDAFNQGYANTTRVSMLERHLQPIPAQWSPPEQPVYVPPQNPFNPDYRESLYDDPPGRDRQGGRGRNGGNRDRRGGRDNRDNRDRDRSNDRWNDGSNNDRGGSNRARGRGQDRGRRSGNGNGNGAR